VHFCELDITKRIHEKRQLAPDLSLHTTIQTPLGCGFVFQGKGEGALASGCSPLRRPLNSGSSPPTTLRRFRRDDVPRDKSWPRDAEAPIC
jgi:hypothetical protein